jgi:hypothetical protein
MTYSPISTNQPLATNGITLSGRSVAASTTPEQVLSSITSSERPRDISLVEWSKMSSVEQLRTVQGIAEPTLQLARAEVVRDRVNIIPETDIRSDLPTFNIPNNVFAEGFSPGLFSHDYIVTNIAPSTLTGAAGLSAVGAALVRNPTPGQDSAATGKGARNDVGNLVLGDGDDNFVRSYVIRSNDPLRSDAIVNYTIVGEHTMSEGFVMRFAELLPNGRIQLVTYGEGAALKQSEALSGIWEPIVNRVWTENAQEIFSSASKFLNP